MKPEDFSLEGGRVVHFDLAGVDRDLPAADQVHLLKEDLMQVAFDDELIVDVGWYPEFQADGAFLVQVIRGEDWDNPVRRTQCRRVRALVVECRAATALACAGGVVRG